MSKQHDRITKRLSTIGAAWAVRSDKFCDAKDSLEAQQAGRKMYRIHPDAEYPDWVNVERFESLTALEDWLDEVESELAAFFVETFSRRDD